MGGDGDPIARRDVIQPLAAVLADPDHVAAGPYDAGGRDQALDARQAVGQRPRFVLRGVRFAGRDPVPGGDDLRLCLGAGGVRIFRRVPVRITARARGAPITADLTLQLLDHGLMLCAEGQFLGHHGLLMLARCALEQNRCNGLRHLWGAGPETGWDRGAAIPAAMPEQGPNLSKTKWNRSGAPPAAIDGSPRCTTTTRGQPRPSNSAAACARGSRSTPPSIPAPRAFVASIRPRNGSIPAGPAFTQAKLPWSRPLQISASGFGGKTMPRIAF